MRTFKLANVFCSKICENINFPPVYDTSNKSCLQQHRRVVIKESNWNYCQIFTNDPGFCRPSEKTLKTHAIYCARLNLSPWRSTQFTLWTRPVRNGEGKRKRLGRHGTKLDDGNIFSWTCTARRERPEHKAKRHRSKFCVRRSNGIYSQLTINYKHKFPGCHVAGISAARRRQQNGFSSRSYMAVKHSLFTHGNVFRAKAPTEKAGAERCSRMTLSYPFY